jgi:hypothetical protein
MFLRVSFDECNVVRIEIRCVGRTTLYATTGQRSFNFVPVRLFSFGGQGRDPMSMSLIMSMVKIVPSIQVGPYETGWVIIKTIIDLHFKTKTRKLKLVLAFIE